MNRMQAHWQQSSLARRVLYGCSLIVALGGAAAVISGWLDAPGRAYIVYAVEREYGLSDTLRRIDARIDLVDASVQGMRSQVDTLSVRQQRMLTNQSEMLLLMVLQGGGYTEVEKRRILTKLRTGQITLDSLLKEAMLR